MPRRDGGGGDCKIGKHVLLTAQTSFIPITGAAEDLSGEGDLRYESRVQ